MFKHFNTNLSFRIYENQQKSLLIINDYYCEYICSIKKIYTSLDYLLDLLLDVPFPHIMDLNDKNGQQTV